MVEAFGRRTLPVVSLGAQFSIWLIRVGLTPDFSDNFRVDQSSRSLAVLIAFPRDSRSMESLVFVISNTERIHKLWITLGDYQIHDMWKDVGELCYSWEYGTSDKYQI